MSAEEDVVAATAGLPLEARLSHTSWKVRADAYAAVARETAADSPLLQDFGARRCCPAPTPASSEQTAPLRRVNAGSELSHAAPLAVRSLSDSNTNALDGAVEAVVALLTAVGAAEASRRVADRRANATAALLKSAPPQLRARAGRRACLQGPVR